MKNNKKKTKKINSFAELAKPLDNAAENKVPSDIDGSYTGHPIDGGKPVQDADDL